MCLMDKVEFLILRNLIHNEEYIRKVIPFIKADYFEDYNQKVVFEEIIKFVEEYNKPATKEILCIEGGSLEPPCGGQGAVQLPSKSTKEKEGYQTGRADGSLEADWEQGFV